MLGLQLALLFVLSIATSATPNFHGCITPVAKAQPYCNVSLTMEERVASLSAALTLQEKISVIAPRNVKSYDPCPVPTPAIPRVGFPEYIWLIETNTGVASDCLAPGQCATTFPGPEGLAASFNRTSWFAKGDVISTEMRAFNNHGGRRAEAAYVKIGLTGYGPNINIARDPRFGRNSELPGEDPYLSGSYATAYVHGMQQVDSKGYSKMISYLKHYDAYSVETNRGHDTYNISQFDFWDTYLPQYQMAFTAGMASGAMCSYPGQNGHPSCANGWLINNVVRKKWQRDDAVITTDCGVVPNLFGPPVHAPTNETAAAYTIMNGTDIEAGSQIWVQFMAKAIQEGLASAAAVDASFTRAMMQHFKAGRFDPPDMVSWTSIPASVISSPSHQQVNYEAALQSFILLKNENGILPLRAGSNIAVLGPQGEARFGLLSDYYGDHVCVNGSFACIPSIAEEIAKANQGGVTSNFSGVSVSGSDPSGIAQALSAGANADVIVLVLGIDKTVEHEGVDRVEIGLPGLQVPFAQQVLALGKPVVLVLTNGGALAIDVLVDGPQAIIEAFNPSQQGARALAATLFGQSNKWGKLPITVYDANFVQQQKMTDFNMTHYPGRTYRYYQGSPLWTFGYGLSYTTFDLSCKQVGGSARATAGANAVPWPQPAPSYVDQVSANFTFTCLVSNSGKMDGDEVIQVYHSAGADIRSAVDHPVPIKALVEFERVTVPSGKSQTLTFELPSSSLALTNLQGNKVVYPGQHHIIFSRGHGPVVDISITV